MTFGYLSAQQISSIIFQCCVLYHAEFDFLCLLIHLRPRKNGFKYSALLIDIFISFKGNIIWTSYGGPVTSLSVAFIPFAKKVAIDFCQLNSQLFPNIVLIEFIKQNEVGGTVLV